MVPKSLRLPLLVRTPFGKQVIAQAEKRLLQARVLETKAIIKRLENDVFFAQQSLEHTLATDVFDVLLYANSAATNAQEQRQQGQEKKFTRLTGRSAEAEETPCVYNLSSHQLDPAERSLLNKGLNFNTGSVPDAKSMICAIELAVRKVDVDLRDEVRARAIGALSKLRKEKKKTALFHALIKQP